MMLDKQDRWTYYTFGLPFIGAFGAYMGWLTHDNRSLKESVAVHTWYDFTLFALSAFGAPSAMISKPSFALRFEF
jgi:hypothetical protein